MAGLTQGQARGRAFTIALLERKTSISRDLFSRYWRDVHGVMAARIPGFESYVQHHVAPMADVGSDMVEPFEGIAVVSFARPEDRAGLIHSEVTRHIHRDEQNVFRRALLYNLESVDSQFFGPAIAPDGESVFLVVPQGVDGIAIADDLAAEGAIRVDLHDLRHADPAGWNETDVEEGGASRLFAFVIQSWWDGDATDAIRRIVAAAQGSIACYRTEARYPMVEQGRPTQIGLRGLDAVRTIEEAMAVNQQQPEVLRAIYGSIAG